MLANRIIPCLDVESGRVVKGTNFVNLRDAGDQLKWHLAMNEKVPTIVFLDITASHEGRDIMLDVVNPNSRADFYALTVGGGIRTIDDIRSLLNAGTDKVSINSAACKDPEFVREAARKFGSQCIVVNIDPKRVQRDGRSLESILMGDVSQQAWKLFAGLRKLKSSEPVRLCLLVWTVMVRKMVMT